MKPCPVRVAHKAHYHPNVGNCPGISTADIMRQVEARRTDAFTLAQNLTRKLGVVVSPQRVRRDMDLWRRVNERIPA